MKADTASYDVWFSNVKAALDSINMPMDTWQAPVGGSRLPDVSSSLPDFRR
jgi:hypothetical protein